VKVAVFQNWSFSLSLARILGAQLGFALNEVNPVLIVEDEKWYYFAYRVKKDKEEGEPNLVHPQ